MTISALLSTPIHPIWRECNKKNWNVAIHLNDFWWMEEEEPLPVLNEQEECKYMSLWTTKTQIDGIFPFSCVKASMIACKYPRLKKHPKLVSTFGCLQNGHIQVLFLLFLICSFLFILELSNRISKKKKSNSTLRGFGKYNLVEKRAVRDRKSKRVQAHSQHHVVRRVITVAPAAAVEEPRHSLSAEHHAAAMATDATETQTHTRSAEYERKKTKPTVVTQRWQCRPVLLWQTRKTKQ